VSARKNQVTVLDMAGDFASAKLATTQVDYVTLSKLTPVTNAGVCFVGFQTAPPALTNIQAAWLSSALAVGINLSSEPSFDNTAAIPAGFAISAGRTEV